MLTVRMFKHASGVDLALLRTDSIDDGLFKLMVSVPAKHMLLPVNGAAAGNLVVGMSTCYGLFGAGMALHPHDAPFRSLIGPVDTVTFADSAVAFTAFYHQMSKGVAIERAVEVMKVASGEEHFGLVDGEITRMAVRNAITDLGLKIPAV